MDQFISQGSKWAQQREARYFDSYLSATEMVDTVPLLYKNHSIHKFDKAF